MTKEEAKDILRGMICSNEYEAIELAIRAINTCINNKYDVTK